jgi:lycopene cyclase domain-containing protein
VTYFAVLLTFVVPPLVLIIAGRVIRLWQDHRQGAPHWQPLLIVLLHALLALVYTMPWDNYLVASGVWWYGETLVTGLSIGYIPIDLLHLTNTADRTMDTPPVGYPTLRIGWGCWR